MPQSDVTDLPADSAQEIAVLFGLLSATVRVQLLWLLAQRESDVGTLAQRTGQTIATVSHHLAKLKLAGLVRARRHGKHQIYLLNSGQVADLLRLAQGHDPVDDEPPGRTRSASEPRGTLTGAGRRAAGPA